MKITHKFLIALKNLTSPLPNPKKECAEKYWNAPLFHLSGHQVELITSLVIEGAKVSRNFGLFIRPEDLDFEILYWLTFVNFNGGPKSLKRHLSYEEAWTLATLSQDQEFGDINKFYFNHIKDSKTKVIANNNAYGAHLEDVRSKILSAIYNDKLPVA